MTCSFLFACCGYYRYDRGYLPEFEGMERFGGSIVHPQAWPEDLDYTGKRVLVIGSGATAVTLAPAMAGRAAHVTMLQRSPSYVLTLPAQDALANLLRRIAPPRLAYAAGALEERGADAAFFRLSRRRPRLDEGRHPLGRQATASTGVRRRHPLQAALQPVGPAPLPRARRRPLRGHRRMGG